MSRAFRLAATLGLPALGAVLGAQPARAFDIVMKASIINTKFQGADQRDPYSITGFAPSLLWMIDWTKRISGGVSVQPLVNFTEKEISRTAADGVFEFALLGQTHKLDDQFDAAEVTSTGRWALNFIGHLGYHFYNATPGSAATQTAAQRKASKVTGSTLQGLAGLGIRIDITDETSAGVEALYTVLSLSNSKENLTAAEGQTGFYYRFEF